MRKGGAFTTTDWLHLGTLLSVLLGAGLVVFELRQVHRLERANLSADSWNQALGQYRAAMGENVALALARNCAGQTLDEHELFQVHLYLDHIWNRGLRLRQIEILGEFGADLDALDQGIMSEYLAFPRGRMLFQTFGEYWPEHYRNAAAYVLKHAAYDNCVIRTQQLGPVQNSG